MPGDGADARAARDAGLVSCPTAINVVQCLGWTVFELLVIATAAAALSDELFGFGAQWAWTLVFGAAGARAGPARADRRRAPLRAARRGLGGAASRSPTSTWWALTGGGLARAWNRPGEGGLSVWQGVDIVVGVTVSWIPLAADYTRFAPHAARRLLGHGHRLPAPGRLLLALGAVLLLTRDLGDAAALPAAVAAGGLVALLALLALTVAETDEAFANAYSGAVSLQNLVPRRAAAAARSWRRRPSARSARSRSSSTSYQSFLFLLGSFFVPLFAVLLADWLVAGLALRRGRRLRRACRGGRA